MVVRMKHTRGKRNHARSHHALATLSLSRCSHCGKEKLAHVVCLNCGWYNQRQVIDVLAKLGKKERKQKQKELTEAEAESAKPLDARELSQKS